MSGLVLHRDQWLEDSSPSQNPVLVDSYSLSELTNWKGEGTNVPQARDEWDSSTLALDNDNNNLWLYRVYIRMQEPQKKLQIYQKTSARLLSAIEPFARYSLDLHFGGFKHAPEGLYFSKVLGYLTQWSSLDLASLLAKWKGIRDTLKRLSQSIPESVRNLSLQDVSALTSRHTASRTPTNSKIGSLPEPRIVDIQPVSQRHLDFDETLGALRAALSSKDEIQKIMKLQGFEAQGFIDLLDQAIDNAEPKSRIHTQCLHCLRKLCGRTLLFPVSCNIRDGLERQSDVPQMSGGFADIWLGRYKGRSVGLKVLRVYGSDNLSKVKKAFCREAVLWKTLSHPNIVPFLGASTKLFPLCMVCPWMENGNIVTYLKRCPKVNRLDLLVDISKGLFYLHSIGVLHGDVKGANILISDDCRACLSDFGLTAVTYDPNTVNAITTSSAVHGSIRWMAPEVLHPAQSDLDKPLSAESDIYAFSMVMYEVFSGKVPFHEQAREAAVVFKVTLGIRPTRPIDTVALGLSDIVWDLMEMCWQAEWRKRPRISFVRQCLEEAVRQFVPPIEQAHQERVREDIDVDDSSDDEHVGPYREDFTLPRFPQSSTSASSHDVLDLSYAAAIESLNLNDSKQTLAAPPSSAPSPWKNIADPDAWV